MAKLAGMVVCLVACNSESPAMVDAPEGATDGANADAASSDPPGTMASMMIGSTGGSLEADGATLVIPGGALASDVAITITKTTDPGPYGTSPSTIYVLEPEGQTFTMPVTFTLHLAAPPGGGETIFWSKLGIANPTLITDYETRPTTVAGSDVSAPNTHFSHVYAARIFYARQ